MSIVMHAIALFIALCMVWGVIEVLRAAWELHQENKRLEREIRRGK